jgi:hypothetical protein
MGACRAGAGGFADKEKEMWLDHTMRKLANNITRQTSAWNPQEKRSRGRPRNSWRRDTENELKTRWDGRRRIVCPQRRNL